MSDEPHAPDEEFDPGELVAEGDGDHDDAVIDAELVLEPEAPAGALVRARRAAPAVGDQFRAYLAQVRGFPRLEPEEERDLVRRYRETGDREAAARLITANLLLVVKLALAYRRLVASVMDLVQEGNVGLLEALKRYDPEKGTRFSTYAAWWIKAYILKYLQDTRRIVRFGTTNSRRWLLKNLRAEQEKLAALGITPTPQLLAQTLELPEDDIIEAEKVLASGDESLDRPLGDDTTATIADVTPDRGPPADAQLLEAELRDKVRAAVAEFREMLGERDRIILDERLEGSESATLQELGDRFGVTREAMRQAEVKLKKRMAVFLRERLGDDVIRHLTGEG